MQFLNLPDSESFCICYTLIKTSSSFQICMGAPLSTVMYFKVFYVTYCLQNETVIYFIVFYVTYCLQNEFLFQIFRCVGAFFLLQSVQAYVCGGSSNTQKVVPKIFCMWTMTWLQVHCDHVLSLRINPLLCCTGTGITFLSKQFLCTFDLL